MKYKLEATIEKIEHAPNWEIGELNEFLSKALSDALQLDFKVVGVGVKATR